MQSLNNKAINEALNNLLIDEEDYQVIIEVIFNHIVNVITIHIFVFHRAYELLLMLLIISIQSHLPKSLKNMNLPSLGVLLLICTKEIIVGNKVLNCARKTDYTKYVFVVIFIIILIYK